MDKGIKDPNELFKMFIKTLEEEGRVLDKDRVTLVLTDIDGSRFSIKAEYDVVAAPDESTHMALLYKGLVHLLTKDPDFLLDVGLSAMKEENQFDHRVVKQDNNVTHVEFTRKEPEE